MPQKTNGALSWVNYFDQAGLTASSAAAGLPIGNLQSEHLSTKWRSDGALSVYWTVDFGDSLPVDAVGVFGANFTEDAQWRIRLSATAAHDGDVLDSGLIDMDRASILLRRGQALYLPDETVTARYLKIDFADSGLGYLEAGLAWAGPLFQPARNFAYGQAPAVQDPSTTTYSVGGQGYTDQRPRKMSDTFTFPALTEAEAQQALELDALGAGTNLLWIKNPRGALMNSTAILGTNAAPAPQPSVSHDRRSRQFQIVERL